VALAVFLAAPFEFEMPAVTIVMIFTLAHVGHRFRMNRSSSQK
jgi:hypothetical protein